MVLVYVEIQKNPNKLHVLYAIKFKDCSVYSEIFILLVSAQD